MVRLPKRRGRTPLRCQPQIDRRQPAQFLGLKLATATVEDVNGSR